MYRLYSVHPGTLMRMPDTPQLILAAFLTWPYDPEESQKSPCCLHTGPELGNLIPLLGDNCNPGLPPAEVREQKSAEACPPGCSLLWCRTPRNTVR